MGETYPGAVKLNVDGAYEAQDATAGAGMILRDSSCRIIFSSCRSLRECCCSCSSME
jgi:hypothetical protein